MSCHTSPPTSACAAFMKESRMEFINPIKVCRKSGEAPPSLFATRKKTFRTTQKHPPKGLVSGHDFSRAENSPKSTGFSPCNNTSHRNPCRGDGTAPQGRPIIAQHAVLGYVSPTRSSPEGTTENYPGCDPGRTFLKQRKSRTNIRSSALIVRRTTIT
jgi:hypothetical protein